MDGKGFQEKVKIRKAGLILLRDILGVKEAFLSSGVEDKSVLFAKLEEVVLRCRKCPLYKTKRKYVFGEGNPFSPIMLIGEAPGKEEDIHGKPFVGRAGQVLTHLLHKAGVEREEMTYIANVLKCRPPGNRDPLPDEIVSCSPYLELQISSVRPSVLVAMGRFALQFLLDKGEGIKASRGIVHESRYGIPVIVTYHPAALLRNPILQEAFLQDIEMALEVRDKRSG